MSNLNKITNEDIIDSGAFTGGTYGAANKLAIESVGYDAAIADSLVKRTSTGGIVALEIESTNILMDATTLGFFGETPIVQPLTITAPTLAVGTNDNDVEDAIIELQATVEEILTVLKDLGLVAQS
jgi:hypothetical protein